MDWDYNSLVPRVVAVSVGCADNTSEVLITVEIQILGVSDWVTYNALHFKQF